MALDAPDLRVFAALPGENRGAEPVRRSDAEAVKRLIQYDRAEIGQAEAASPTVAD